MSGITLPLRVRALTVEDGMDIAMWPCPGPWSAQDALETPRRDQGYWAVRDAADRLVGFCCLGDAARPVGLDRTPGVLDVAIGMRPELTGQGAGGELAHVAVAHAAQVSDGRRIRCTVQASNRRGLDTARAAGFEPVGERDVAGRPHILLELPSAAVVNRQTSHVNSPSSPPS